MQQVTASFVQNSSESTNYIYSTLECIHMENIHIRDLFSIYAAQTFIIIIIIIIQSTSGNNKHTTHWRFKRDYSSLRECISGAKYYFKILSDLAEFSHFF